MIHKYNIYLLKLGAKVIIKFIYTTLFSFYS
ncbi:MAG: DNA-binding response regulator, partial [Flavobacterium sp.]